MGAEVDDEIVVGRVGVHACQRARGVAADPAQVGRAHEAKRVHVRLIDASLDVVRIREVAVVMAPDFDSPSIEGWKAVYVAEVLGLADEDGKSVGWEPV